MTTEIEQRTAPGTFCIPKPEAGTCEPLIQARRVCDTPATEGEIAQETVIKGFLRKHQIGVTARWQRDHELYPCFLHSFDDSVAFIDGDGESFFGEDMLTRFRRRNHHSGVI